MKDKGYRAVHVEWVDSAGRSGWQTSKAAKESGVSLCRSVGWLIDENPKHICIAHSHDIEDGGGICDSMSIPRCAIRRVRKLPLWSKG